jgi:hypothetical protein
LKLSDSKDPKSKVAFEKDNSEEEINLYHPVQCSVGQIWKYALSQSGISSLTFVLHEITNSEKKEKKKRKKRILPPSIKFQPVAQPPITIQGKGFF